MEVIDHQKRIFEGYASVEVKDKDGDTFPISDVLGYMIDYADIGGVLHDSHTYKVVGKMLNWEETEKNGVPAVRITGKIYDNLPLHNQIWDKIKSGEYGGLSIGGEGTLQEDGQIKIDGGLFEISVCERGANQESTIEAVSIAKKDCGNMRIKKERKYLKPGEKPPEGAQVQQGKRGGQYYEAQGGSKDKGHSSGQEKGLTNELNEIASNYDKYTTSDLQAVVSEIAQRYNVDEDLMLEEVYEKVEELQNKKPSEKLKLEGESDMIRTGTDGEPDSYYSHADDDIPPASKEELINPEVGYDKFNVQALRDIKEIDLMIWHQAGIKDGRQLKDDPKKWEQYKKFVNNSVMPKISKFSKEEQASLFLSLEDANFHSLGKALSELGMKTSYDEDYGKGDTMKKSIKKEGEMLSPPTDENTQEEVNEASKLDSILETLAELKSKVEMMEERMGKVPDEDVTESDEAEEDDKKKDVTEEDDKPEEKKEDVTEEDESEEEEDKKVKDLVKKEIKKHMKNITKAKTPNPSIGNSPSGKEGTVSAADIAMGRHKL